MDRARRAARAPVDGHPGPHAGLILRLVAALAILAALAPAAGAQGTDAVRIALERADVFVGSGQLGPAAAAARRDLAAVAAELRADDRPVKLAVVPGRGDSRALLAYARRLRRDLDFDGTVVLTTPGGATAAAGPRESAEVTIAMRRVRIGRIPDPVQRLISAAEVTAAPPRSNGGTTAALTLLGLAVLGGAWAVGMGAGRRSRRSRERLAEERAAMRVHLDTLRARASALARGGRLTDASRPRVQAALGTYAEAVAALQQAASAEEVAGLAPRVAAGLDAVGAAARDAGEDWADELDDDPFAGLCAADPAHGPPDGEGPLFPGGEDVPLCARCVELTRRGEPAPLRMVPAGGRPVPFTETAGLLRGSEEGAAAP